MLSSQQLIKNRQKILDKLLCDGFIVIHAGYPKQKSADANYKFVVNNNFYYLTGMDQEGVILVMVKRGHETSAYVFIEPRDEVKAKWIGHKITKEEASLISGITAENIKYITEFDSFINQIVSVTRYGGNIIEQVYLDLEQNELPQYNNFGLEYSKYLRNEYPALKINNVYHWLVEARMLKDSEEIDHIKASVDTTKTSIYHVMINHTKLQNEKVAAALYHYNNYLAGKESSFESIIAGGKNATILHYVANNQPLKQDDLLLMDVGCYTEHYSSDISRTFPISGKFTTRQKEIYEVVLECNKKCIDFVKEGITWLQLNDYANSILVEGCKRLGLINDASELRKYYYHSIGHSLGLDVHDPCLRERPLTAGMVITIEPGLYIEEEAIGIRIEDNIVVTNEKAINLSSSIVKEVIDIEKMMA